VGALSSDHNSSVCNSSGANNTSVDLDCMECDDLGYEENTDANFFAGY